MEVEQDNRNGSVPPAAVEGNSNEDNKVEMLSSCPLSQESESMSMDAVDAAAPSTIPGPSSAGACALIAYKTDEDGNGEGESNSTKNCVLKMLDEMEERVDKLRVDAMKLEAERDDVLASLDTLKNSQLVHDLNSLDLDEVNRYASNLTSRAAAIRVDITTERSSFQQESLFAVNSLIDTLIREIQSDVPTAQRRCISYLNACCDESAELFQKQVGIDTKFEQAVLGCTLEDQKRVKKRLQGLYSYFQTYNDGVPQSLPKALTKIEEEK